MALDEISVDVLTCAYNHEKYIGENIESVLKQRTNFKVRHIIGEDCSSDRTKEIIAKYHAENREKILPLFHKINLGPGKNTEALFKHANAKYIAFLDGDDYWADPQKLQKQVDFLEANPTYAACYHGCKFVNENNELIKSSKSKQYSDFDRLQLLCSEGALITNAVLFRNVLKFPDFMEQVPNGDAFFWHLIGFHGHAKFLSDIDYSAYRVHFAGIWTSSSNADRLASFLITKELIIRNIRLNFPGRQDYTRRVNETVKKEFIDYFYRQLYHGRIKEYIRGIKLLVNYKELNTGVVLLKHIGNIFKRLFKR